MRPGPLGPSLQELQHELAWRLGQWEPSPAQPGAAQGGAAWGGGGAGEWGAGGAPAAAGGTLAGGPLSGAKRGREALWGAGGAAGGGSAPHAVLLRGAGGAPGFAEAALQQLQAQQSRRAGVRVAAGPAPHTLASSGAGYSGGGGGGGGGAPAGFHEAVRACLGALRAGDAQRFLAVTDAAAAGARAASLPIAPAAAS